MNRSRKPSPRLFVDAGLDGGTLKLDAEQAHYLGRVLRCRDGDPLVVFNGRGTERAATIASLAKKRARIDLADKLEPIPEPAFRITLLQALVKSDAMDLIVQKATELGVTRLVAVHTEFSVVHLAAERRDRRLQHWRRIATGACEQSGRHRPPAIDACGDLDTAIATLGESGPRLAFTLGRHPGFDPAAIDTGRVSVAIGPEGGFSPGEAPLLEAAGFTLHSLGPRTLRAETAAIAVCSSLSLHADAAAETGVPTASAR
jgi:16S rRNA (uracil1498-N3)-methyltransferase